MNYYPPEVVIGLVGGTFLSWNITMKNYRRAFNKAEGSVPAATVKLGGLSTHSSSSCF